MRVKHVHHHQQQQACQANQTRVDANFMLSRKPKGALNERKRTTESLRAPGRCECASERLEQKKPLQIFCLQRFDQLP